MVAFRIGDRNGVTHRCVERNRDGIDLQIRGRRQIDQHRSRGGSRVVRFVAFDHISARAERAAHRIGQHKHIVGTREAMGHRIGLRDGVTSIGLQNTDMLDLPKERIAAHIEELVERKIDIVVPDGLQGGHGTGPDVRHRPGHAELLTDQHVGITRDTGNHQIRQRHRVDVQRDDGRIGRRAQIFIERRGVVGEDRPWEARRIVAWGRSIAGIGDDDQVEVAADVVGQQHCDRARVGGTRCNDSVMRHDADQLVGGVDAGVDGQVDRVVPDAGARVARSDVGRGVADCEGRSGIGRCGRRGADNLQIGLPVGHQGGGGIYVVGLAGALPDAYGKLARPIGEGTRTGPIEIDAPMVGINVRIRRHVDIVGAGGDAGRDRECPLRGIALPRLQRSRLDVHHVAER